MQVKSKGDFMPLEFFIGWAQSDPFYQDFFSDCNMLISPPQVSQSWNINRFKHLPSKLMIDSGGYSLITSSESVVSQKEVFKRQLSISDGTSIPTLICHLDDPISISSFSFQDINTHIEKTISNAYEFMHLFRTSHLPSNYKSMGIIQGNDYRTISYCAQELKRIGFDYYGLGSLANLHDNEMIIERVKYAMEIVGCNLHVFGIAALQTINQLNLLQICSCDSTRPMKAAMYTTVLYSKPFRGYLVPKSRIKRDTPVLHTPLPCDCPICAKNANLLLETGTKKSNNDRAVHNYYHLVKEINNGNALNLR